MEAIKKPRQTLEERDEVMMNVRIPRPLHSAFKEMMKERDETASQVIRKFLRHYVNQSATSPN